MISQFEQSSLTFFWKFGLSCDSYRAVFDSGRSQAIVPPSPPPPPPPPPPSSSSSPQAASSTPAAKAKTTASMPSLQRGSLILPAVTSGSPASPVFAHSRRGLPRGARGRPRRATRHVPRARRGRLPRPPPRSGSLAAPPTL